MQLPMRTFVIRDDIKKLVVAERSNLTDPGACKKYWGADFILLRNVLIYFDPLSKPRSCKLAMRT